MIDEVLKQLAMSQRITEFGTKQCEILTVVNPEDHARGGEGGLELCPLRGCRKQSPPPTEAGVLMHSV